MFQKFTQVYNSRLWTFFGFDRRDSSDLRALVESNVSTSEYYHTHMDMETASSTVCEKPSRPENFGVSGVKSDPSLGSSGP